MTRPAPCRPIAPATRTLDDVAAWLVHELGYPLDTPEDARPVPEPLRWPIARVWAGMDPDEQPARVWYGLCADEGGWSG